MNDEFEAAVTNNQSPVFSAFAYTLLEEILANASHPARLNRQLVEQLRELTEARLVVLARQRELKDGGYAHELAAVEPERRRALAESPAMMILADLTRDLDGPTVWEKGHAPLKADALLEENLPGPAVAVPLRVGRKHVGTLLLFELPHEHRPDQVINVLGTLSRVVALVLQNAALYEDQEAAIAARTRELAESEEQLAVTLRSIGDAVIATDLQGKVTLMNPVAEGLTDWEEAEAIGKPLDEVFHIVNEETRRQAENPVACVLREGVVVGLANHTLLIVRDGREIPIADSGAPIRDAKGEITGVVLVFRDQTEERAAQKARRESEERFRSIFDQASVSIWEEDFSELKHALDDLEARGATDFRAYFDAHPEFVEQAVGMVKILDVNDETVRMFEAESKEDLLGSLHKTFTPESLTIFRNELVAIAKGQSRFEQPAIVQTLHGKPIHILLRLTTLEGDPSLHRVLVSMMDITERVQAENELRLREQQLSLIYDSTGDALYYLKVEPGSHYRFLTVNSAFLKATGLTGEQIVGKTINEVIPEPSLQLVRSNYEKAIREKRIVYWEETSQYPAGLKTGIVSIAPVFDEEGHCSHLVGSVHDITERVRAEEAIVRAAQEWQATFDATSDVVWLLDKEQHVLRSNEAAERIFQQPREALIGKHCWEIVHGTTQPVPECPLLRMKNSLRRESMELQIGEGWFNITVDPILDADGEYASAVHIISDITERKRAEEALKEYSERLEEMVEDRTQKLREAQEQLVRREKLAVLGQLAGGMAHELRNPLGAISNVAYLLDLLLESPPPEVAEALQILDREVQNSDRIITSLLDFARPRPPIAHRVDVNAVVEEALSRAEVPANVALARELDESLPHAVADPTHLRQALGNIIRNAVQAMPEGRQLVIKTWQVSERPARSGQIAISFTDAGVGIPKENLDKLFEPLFTTKAKGIGLGLALCKMLVEASGGTIEVQSEMGKGSTFTVRLPVEGGSNQ